MNPTYDEILRWFYINNSDLVQRMRDTSHSYDKDNHSPYHLEGDVLTHTLMVLKNCFDYNAELKFVLSALCHDVGKCYTREVIHEKKKVRFVGHAGVSFYMSVKILSDFIKDFPGVQNPDKLMLDVLKIVALHNDVVTSKLKADRYVYDAELYNDLITFRSFDSEGTIRFLEDENDINCVYLGSKERQCDAKVNIHYMIGAPCSGKTTYIQNSELKDLPVLSRDLILETMFNPGGSKSYNQVWGSLTDDDQHNIDVEFSRLNIELMNSGRDFVVDKTNQTKKSRARVNFRKSHKKIGYVFLTDFWTILKRNSEREGKVLKEEIILNMMKYFEYPLLTEMDEIRIVKC